MKMEAKLSKCAGSKVKKTEKPSQKVSKRTSHSEKTESEGDEEFDWKDVFSGDKDLNHNWKAQFEILVDQMKVPAKTKMMLKNSLSGKPLRIVERLGYTLRQYKTALEKLDQEYGGEKRLMQRHHKAILQASPVKDAYLRELEIFSDWLIEQLTAIGARDLPFYTRGRYPGPQKVDLVRLIALKKASRNYGK